MSQSLSSSTNTKVKPSSKPKPSVKEFAGVLKAMKWYDLGVFLGAEAHELNEINGNYKEEGAIRCLIELYQCLEKKGGDLLTWEAIATACRELQNHAVADRIHSKYIAPVLQQSAEAACLQASSSSVPTDQATDSTTEMGTGSDHHDDDDVEVIEGSIVEEIASEYYSLSLKYNTLLTNVKRAFTKREDKLGEVRQGCLKRTLTNIKKAFIYIYTKDELEDVQDCLKRLCGVPRLPPNEATAEAVFDRVEEQCSLLNLDILRVLVEEYIKNKSLLADMEGFISDVDAFKCSANMVALVQLIQQNRQQIVIADGRQKMVELKVRKFWKGFTAEKFEILLNELFRTLYCKMRHVTVKSGSICLTWFIPDIDTTELLPVLPLELVRLIGVIYLCIGNDVIYNIEGEGCESIKAAMLQAIELKNTRAIELLLAAVGCNIATYNGDNGVTNIGNFRANESKESSSLDINHSVEPKGKNGALLEAINKTFSKESKEKEAESLTPEKQTDKPQDTTGEFEKLRKENEELLAKIRRHKDLTAIIQQRKQENETLHQTIKEKNKEIETLHETKELEAMGRVVSPTSEADKQDKDDILKEPKREDAKLIEDEWKMKEMSENQLQYEQNIESLKREFEEKLEKEKERGRSELESVREQLEEKQKKLETVNKILTRTFRENEEQKDEIKNNMKTIGQKEEELYAKNEECQKLDADITAITKEKNELQQLKDDVEKKVSEAEKQNDDLRVECQELQTSSIKLRGEYDTLQGEYGTLQGEFNKRPLTLAFYHLSHTHYVPVTMVMTNFNDYKKKNFQWFSPGFYTRLEGYKLCVKVDANGKNSGRGTHVSAYVHLMQGEYDNRLTWPFTAKVQRELLNRQADENHRLFIAEFNQSSDIVSRSRIMGAGIITDSGSLASKGEGEDRLISHGDLGYNSSTFTEFLKDDSIYIRVKSVDIQMATEIPPSPVPLHTTYPTDKFTLKEFSKLKAKNKEWQSDPFYTHEKGYKFVLVVQPNGEYTYKGRYIAMFLHITRGEYDDQLVFPFRGNIYVHLVNQVDDQNHSEFLVKYDEESDPKGRHGGRVPRFNFSERSSEGWGTASLIRHDLLPYNKYRRTKYLTDNDEIEFRIHKIEVFSG